MRRLGNTGIELLRRLARLPFLDRLELAALTGRSRGGAAPSPDATVPGGPDRVVPGRGL